MHDAIQPMVSSDIISGCISTTKQYGNAITGIPCAEAMLETNDGIMSNSSYPRERLKRPQTPQGFHLGELYKEYLTFFKYRLRDTTFGIPDVNYTIHAAGYSPPPDLFRTKLAETSESTINSTYYLLKSLKSMIL